MRKRILLPVIAVFAGIFVMVGCNESQPLEKPNVLLICVDDLRPELNCYGTDYVSSPNIDNLAESGTLFLKHYTNAPSCGPSRYTLLTGQYGPAGNNALFQRAEKMKQEEEVDPSMPGWFKAHGYTTVSVGKVSHHPGGKGGPDWDDSNELEMPGAWDRSLLPVAEWEHPRGVMHGLANGEIRKDAGEMDVFQTAVGADTIYPDGLITNTAMDQLKELTAADADKPFFLAVGIIKPHLPFGAPQSYFERYDGLELPPIAHPQKPEGITTWHRSGEFMKYNRWGKDPNTDREFADEVRRHYAACVSYADAQVGKILTLLKNTGADKNTIVVLWGDHGWHLGEHAVWGKHTLFEEALHSPLIIQYPDMKNKGSKTNATVATLDIFPTLCDLTGIEMPGFADGVSLREVLENPASTGHPAFGYWKDDKTVRTQTHRLIMHDDGYIELYEHTTMGDETENIADSNPELSEELKGMISAKSKP